MKTASRVLGTAFFAAGYEVQDAPRYGAERRGAPIFAYVRAAHGPIHARGVIDRPDLVVVADDSLVQVAQAGVRLGVDEHAVLLLRSREPAETWRSRLAVAGRLLVLPLGDADHELRMQPLLGIQCTGAAARLCGVIEREQLRGAVERELGKVSQALRDENVRIALEAFDAMAEHAGVVQPRPLLAPADQRPPDWVELPFDGADVSAPSIHAGGSSVQVRTGLWRTLRPVIDHERCHRCNWMCSLPCPDNALPVDDEGYPHVDLDHCKGCMICVAQCPFHVISAVPEHAAQAAEEHAEVGDA